MAGIAVARNQLRTQDMRSSPPDEPRIAFDLAGVSKTLLMPLWARALESQRSDALLRDPKAVAIVEHLDFDFDQFRHKSIDKLGFIIRASLIDRFVREYLAQRPDGTVVELGVGLDTRLDRLDNGRAHWFEVDLPECADLRQKIVGSHPRRRLIAESLLGDGWRDALAAGNPAPPLFVCEGVFYFLPEPELKSLFGDLAQRFPGSRIVFDCQSPLMMAVNNLRHPLSDSRMQWSLRSAKDIEGWAPGLKVERVVGWGDRPDFDAFRSRLSRFSLGARALLPPIRNLFRIICVQLGGAS
ncbi:MAG: class I SAM-dependent methyltransferase [Planctomycetaceae bacterium]|nr:class I SAM-dependent methyltransferase [Planctomycetaceae bacterium]